MVEFITLSKPVIHSAVQLSRNCWKSSEIFRDNMPFNSRQPVPQLEITHRRNCRSDSYACLISMATDWNDFAFQKARVYPQVLVKRMFTRIAHGLPLKACGIGMEKLAPDRKGREEERVVDIIVSCLIFYGDWVGWMFVYLLT